MKESESYLPRSATKPRCSLACLRAAVRHCKLAYSDLINNTLRPACTRKRGARAFACTHSRYTLSPRERTDGHDKRRVAPRERIFRRYRDGVQRDAGLRITTNRSRPFPGVFSCGWIHVHTQTNANQRGHGRHVHTDETVTRNPREHESLGRLCNRLCVRVSTERASLQQSYPSLSAPCLRRSSFSLHWPKCIHLHLRFTPLPLLLRFFSCSRRLSSLVVSLGCSRSFALAAPRRVGFAVPLRPLRTRSTVQPYLLSSTLFVRRPALFYIYIRVSASLPAHRRRSPVRVSLLLPLPPVCLPFGVPLT